MIIGVFIIYLISAYKYQFVIRLHDYRQHPYIPIVFITII